MMATDEGVDILIQEGRDIGLLNKLRAYSLQENGMDTVQANETLGLTMMKDYIIQQEKYYHYLKLKKSS